MSADDTTTSRAPSRAGEDAGGLWYGRTVSSISRSSPVHRPARAPRLAALGVLAVVLVGGCGGGPGQGRFEQVPLLQIAPGEDVTVLGPSGSPGMLVDAKVTFPPSSRRTQVPAASASP
jgi:hypothetical protein